MIIDYDKIQEILQTLSRNKSRSFLTAFGIFWGIFMLVFLMGGGEGLKRRMARNFDGFAQNSCFVMANTTGKAYKGFRQGRTWSLTDRDVDLLRRRVPHVATVTPMLAQWGKVMKYRDKARTGTLKGVRPDYVGIEAPHITVGRFINDGDLRDYRKVCVIGKRVYEELFPAVENPCGLFVCVDDVYYQVIGVSKMSSSVGVMGNAEESIIIPATTMQRIYNTGDRVESIGITTDKGTTVTEIVPQIEHVLRAAHTLAPDDTQALFTFNMEAMFQMVDNLFRGIEILVWLIGVGTLLSGAIGVSNIMMVTVRERTAEIGIRRAIGARPAGILGQIMAESIVLTILAGLSGITLAVLLLEGMQASTVDSEIGEVNFQVSFWMALGAAAVVALLGCLAGLAPGLRALAIKPIEAIRDE